MQSFDKRIPICRFFEAVEAIILRLFFTSAMYYSKQQWLHFRYCSLEFFCHSFCLSTLRSNGFCRRYISRFD